MRKTLLLTVNGTAAPGPWDFGFSSDLGRNVANPWYEIGTQLWGEHSNVFFWQPVAYPAATLQMGKSAQTGVANTLSLLDQHPDTNVILAGYSQGALVTDFVWRDHILTGSHQHRQDDVIGIVNFGDPMRAPGICNGNVVAGFPIPKPVDGFTTGGIAGPHDLTPDQTPDFLLSCNNDGDLYGSAPVGDTPWNKETGVGHDETMIFNLIQNFFDGKNLLALVTEVMSVLGVVATGGLFSLSTLIEVVEGAIGGAFGPGGIPGIPGTGATTPSHVVSIVEALLNGGMFVFAGMGPHMDYAKMVPATTDWIIERAHAHA